MFFLPCHAIPKERSYIFSKLCLIYSSRSNQRQGVWSFSLILECTQKVEDREYMYRGSKINAVEILQHISLLLLRRSLQLARAQWSFRLIDQSILLRKLVPKRPCYYILCQKRVKYKV